MSSDLRLRPTLTLRFLTKVPIIFEIANAGADVQCRRKIKSCTLFQEITQHGAHNVQLRQLTGHEVIIQFQLFNFAPGIDPIKLRHAKLIAKFTKIVKKNIVNLHPSTLLAIVRSYAY